MLVVVIDEFYEWFRIMPDRREVLDPIGRQGRALWVHLMMASQNIDSRAEKLLENMGYRLVLRAEHAGAAHGGRCAQGGEPAQEAGLGYFRKSRRRPHPLPGRVAVAGLPPAREPTTTTSSTPRRRRTTSLAATVHHRVHAAAASTGAVAPQVERRPDAESGRGAEDDRDEALRKPKVGTVIIDQLRQIDFEPYRLWQPPLDVPRPIDDLVNTLPGSARGTRTTPPTPDLVFPVGIIDRPFKHDQQPLLVEHLRRRRQRAGPRRRRSGKTTALQTLICAAAMTHTPEQVQFYCLAYHRHALGTVAGLPHVGGVAVRASTRTAFAARSPRCWRCCERRKRSFPECGITSMEDFRRRKFGGAPGQVPDDAFGDVFLVVDNYRALTAEASTIRNKDLLVGPDPETGRRGQQLRDPRHRRRWSAISTLPPRMRGSWPHAHRAEAGRARRTPSWCAAGSPTRCPPVKPGRGMVAQNYMRLGAEEEGLHTLIARPALRGTAGVGVRFGQRGRRGARGWPRPVPARTAGSGSCPPTIDLDDLRGRRPARSTPAWRGRSTTATSWSGWVAIRRSWSSPDGRTAAAPRRWRRS